MDTKHRVDLHDYSQLKKNELTTNSVFSLVAFLVFGLALCFGISVFVYYLIPFLQALFS